MLQSQFPIIMPLLRWRRHSLPCMATPVLRQLLLLNTTTLPTPRITHLNHKHLRLDILPHSGTSSQSIHPRLHQRQTSIASRNFQLWGRCVGKVLLGIGFFCVVGHGTRGTAEWRRGTSNEDLNHSDTKTLVE